MESKQNQNMVESALNAAQKPFIQHADNGTPLVFLPRADGAWVCSAEPNWRKTPERKEGFCRLHELDSLIKFVSTHKQAGTEIYIDADFADGDISVTAILDGNTADAAGWGVFRAGFNPKHTVSAERWLVNNNCRLNQAEFAALLTNQAKDIVGAHPSDETKRYPSSADVLDFALNLEYTEKTTFKQGYREQDGRINFTFQSEDAGKTETNLKAFERFGIAFTPFQGGESYFVEALLKFRIDKNSGSLVLWYELQHVDDVIERAAREIADKLQAAFPDTAIYYGRPV